MRVRRSLLNFATAGLLMAVTMAVALKATPYLIAWLGTGRYGGYLVINQAYGYLNLLELGLGGALGPLLARAAGTRDGQALRETLGAGARAYLWVAMGTVAVGLALTPVVPRFAAGLSVTEAGDLRRAWVLGLASFLSLPLLPLRTVVEARQLGYVVNLLLAAQSVLITSVALVLASAGCGITGQAAAQVVGVWAFSLALAAGVGRGEPGLIRSAMTTRAGPEVRRSLRGLSWPALLINVSGRLGVLSDNLIVGPILGGRQVTSFSKTQQLAAMGQTVLQSVGGASWAALAELHAQGERETFNRRLVEMSRMVAVLAAAGLAPVVAYNRPFFRLWLRGATPYAGDAVTALAAFNALMLAEQSLWGWCFLATGQIRRVVVPAVAAAAVNVAVSVAATYRCGVTGPLIGSAVAFTGVGLWAVPMQLRRAFGTPVGELAHAVGVPAAAGAAAAWGLWAFARAHEPAGWPGLIAAMSLSALGMLALGAAVLLTPAERALWRQRLAGLRPPRQRGSGS